MTSFNEHLTRPSTAASSPVAVEDRRAFSQTLDRGLQVLELIAAHPQGITVKDITEQLGAHRTNITRLLHTLNLRGYVTRDDLGGYRVGPRLTEMAREVEPMIRRVAHPVLQRLADRLGATTHLTMADGNDALSVLVIEPCTAEYHISYQAGTKRPLSQGASGFAILASRPQSPGEPFEVTRARERGWASSKGQIERGTSGIAAAVPHPEALGYSIGAIYLGAPPDFTEAAAEVMSAAQEIAAALG